VVDVLLTPLGGVSGAEDSRWQISIQRALGIEFRSESKDGAPAIYYIDQEPVDREEFDVRLWVARRTEEDLEAVGLNRSPPTP
jgi:hypothetical protein